MTLRPDPSEFAPFFARYVSLVPEGDILQLLDSEAATTLGALNGISEDKSLHRYAPGKWSIREAYVHVADAERIFAYRALRIARGDKTPLPGFEQDGYVGPSGADARAWSGIVDEFAVVRKATAALFRNLPADAWTRMGIASENPISVLALACNIVGHEIHHRKLLLERYLNG